jgi:poly-gamma-glutamate synthesis protein (capsule biosynthesis protein)
MKRRRSLWAILLLALLASGCASRNAQPPAVGIAAPATTQPDEPSAATPEQLAGTAHRAPRPAPPGWRTIYTRPDFDGAHSIDLRAVGDISLARNVDPVVRRRAPGWLLEPTAALLDGDVTVGNLESPLTQTRRPDALRPGPYRLPADPALVDRLAAFDALSLANNHALDAGPQGLAEAQRTLEQAGIAPLGVAGAACGANEAAIVHDAERVQLLAFNAVVDPEDSADEAQRCGRAWLDESAITQISRLRAASADPIVALVHWGDEYAATPNEQQRTWARRLVAAGADLIIGAHPHVVQPAEPVEAEGRRGFVAYSLGNFVFDQPEQPATSNSVVLRVQLDRQGVGAVEVAPVAIRNTQPAPLALNDPAAQAQLAAITPSTGAPHAWRWDGATFTETALPPGVTVPAAASELTVDLRGNGQPLRATIQDGLAQLWDGDAEIWRNEAAPWQVAGITAGDADNDGRYEILLRLWKPDAQGVLRSHPFLLGWRGGYYRVFWGGSAVAQPLQDAAIGALDGKRNALVVLEGGQRPGDAATHIGVWTWQGWNFQQQWQSPPGSYRRLALLDLDGDGAQEIVAE